METLDTHTVMQIIKMIDTYSAAAYNNIQKAIEKNEKPRSYDIGVFDQMTLLSDELQGYIEGQLNAAELNTGE